MTDVSHAPPIAVAPSFEGVTKALSQMRKELGDAHIAEDKATEIELATAEALNNIVEHSVIYAPSPKCELVVAILDEGVQIDLSDNGPAFAPPCAGQAEASSDQSMMSLGEGGFGWHIIQSLASEVTYRRRNEQNCLCLKFETPSTER
ncbi:MAG: ATP-binding protein [Pseudomonadota bacterium]